jgi:hypothetical protein
MYMSEDVNDIGKMDDPASYKEVMKSQNSLNWREAIEEELRSMRSNDVCDLVEISDGAKRVGCKWVYKIKYDSKGKIERFNVRLIAKVFAQREGIDYTKTLSHVFKKDSFRIMMALVAHYDLDLHQMDVKTAFLNGDLQENVYMAQPEGFAIEGKEHMWCRLKKFIYELKQVSRQWYLRFDEVIKKFGFVKNQVDNCIYFKIKGTMFIILILYVYDILLASSDKNLLYDIEGFFSSNSDMKDIGDASYVLGIEIHRHRTKGMHGLSQKAYIDKVLKRYNMHDCSNTHVPFVKGDKLGSLKIQGIN